MKVYELIDSPEKLARGAFARDSKQERVTYDSPQAVAWCIVGGIKRCYLVSEQEETILKLDRLLRSKKMDSFITTFSDHHSFEKVQAILKEADV